MTDIQRRIVDAISDSLERRGHEIAHRSESGELYFNFKQKLFTIVAEELGGLWQLRLVRADITRLEEDDAALRSKVAQLALAVMAKTRGVKVFLVQDSLWATHEAMRRMQEPEETAEDFVTGLFGVTLPMMLACEQLMLANLGGDA